MNLQPIEAATASHRPVDIYRWHAVLLADSIRNIGNVKSNSDEDVPSPAPETISCAIDLIAEATPFCLLGDPAIDLFYGEIHLSWNKGQKQVVAMCFADRAPLIHHYERVQGVPSVFNIEPASPSRLAYWLGWLDA